jgi:hypothetical protein
MDLGRRGVGAPVNKVIKCQVIKKVANFSNSQTILCNLRRTVFYRSTKTQLGTLKKDTLQTFARKSMGEGKTVSN